MHTRRGEITSPAGRNSREAEAALRAIQDALLSAGGESVDSEDPMLHIATRITDEGLVIELFSRENRALFQEDEVSPTPLLEDLLKIVAGVASRVTNPIAIEGHSRAHASVLRENPAWDIALGRAAGVQDSIVGQLDPGRIARLTSHGEREPAVANPMDVRNDRIELILIRSDI